MAVQLGLSRSDDHTLGLRLEQERRRADRRVTWRGSPERRRADRRRAKVRSLLFTALTLSIPYQLKSHASFLVSARGVSGPRVSTFIDSVSAVEPRKAYDSLIREAAAVYGIEPALIRSVMQAESAFDPSAVSRAGAMGLMQLMPDVAEAFGVEHPLDPRENIMAGARLLRELLDAHHGNIPLVLASYNAGPTAVARYGGVPPFRETRGYVKKITHLIADARHAAND
jgi:soluble lytic murein transglycosylase-like protein